MLKMNSGRGRALVAIAAMLTVSVGVAEARVGGGKSAGSRGSNTYSAPPATSTAPTAAQPMQRTQTPQPAPNMQRPGTQTAPAQASRFGGFGGGMMAGLLGAGLLGMLFGGGFFGGLAGLAGFLGLLLQVALIGGLVWLALRFFRRRQDPGLAGAGAPMQRDGLGGSVPPVGNGPGGGLGGLGGGLGAGLGSGLGGAMGGARPAAAQGGPVPQQKLDIGENDYAAFERSLVEIQDAYSREDVATLWTLCTPEMAGYFQEELNDNARQGVVNKVSDVKLLQGDLSEAWREHDTDYATLAMRFALTDVTLDKATGRVVAGEAKPTEATEVWTFRRDRDADWKLSAIQQVA